MTVWSNIMRTIPKRSLKQNASIIKELEEFFPEVTYKHDPYALDEGPIKKRVRT